MVERKRTPAEIREEYERLQREREERRLQQRTNPKVWPSAIVDPCQHYLYVSLAVYIVTQGTISVGVDATDLFDRYEEDYEEISGGGGGGGGGGLPHIEINRMHISQSIEVDFLYLLSYGTMQVVVCIYGFVLHMCCQVTVIVTHDWKSVVWCP